MLLSALGAGGRGGQDARARTCLDRPRRPSHDGGADGNRGGALTLNEDPPENSCRPAVDVLFRSVAHVYGPNVLAVVMTGMGSDGTRGARTGFGKTAARSSLQDEASSVVWGMPGAVVSAGAADKICPLPEIGQEIVRRVTSSRARPNDVPAAVTR